MPVSLGEAVGPRLGQALVLGVVDDDAVALLRRGAARRRGGCAKRQNGADQRPKIVSSLSPFAAEKGGRSAARPGSFEARIIELKS